MKIDLNRFCSGEDDERKNLHNPMAKRLLIYDRARTVSPKAGTPSIGLPVTERNKRALISRL